MKPALLTAAALIAPFAATAAKAPARDTVHQDLSAAIVVTAAAQPRNRADVLAGVSVLEGPELLRQLRPQIGDTLARLPGVSSTSFGPNASRPILRGFQGERIRVLQDGIGSFDVSNTSVDHAVVVSPQLAERIEVLRGPASLLYGSSAIGGVVNVIDKRIPRRVPDEVVHLDLLGTYGSAADEALFSGVLDLPIGNGIVAHADGSYATNGDLGIGRYVLSRGARGVALASGDPAITALAGLRGRLPNTAATTFTAAGGATVIRDGGNLGFAVSRYETLYGVPTRFDLGTGDGEQVRLDVKQTRVDVRGGLDLPGLFQRINTRVGYADYKHQEIDPEGNVGTTFLNESFEGRIELVQRKRGILTGAVGGQLLVRDFEAIGDESFVPRNQTTQAGVFTQQILTFGRFEAEGSARYENTNISTRFAEFRGQPNDFDRTFSAFSGSIGGSVTAAPGIKLGVNLSRTERAPAAEELLANGPHGGTQAFEVGDRNFTTERALGAELILRVNRPGFTFEASGYYSKFDGYIYEQQTGDIDADSGLPVFQYLQGRARYYGAEGQITGTIARFGRAKLSTDVLADYTNATLLGGLGAVPRIPPLRVLGGATLATDHVSARVEAEWADRQTRVAAFETRTDSYTLVNASLAFTPERLRRLNATLILSANNLFDVDARRHASFLKDFAPLAGRDLRASLRIVY